MDELAALKSKIEHCSHTLGKVLKREINLLDVIGQKPEHFALAVMTSTRFAEQV